jgi:hypothetical protein
LFTGLLLYVVPQGRVAYWVNWQLLGMSKDTWGHLHTLFALLFLVAAVIHIVLNWKTLWKYVFDRARGAINLGLEFAVALLLTFLFLLSAIALLPPLSYVVDLGGMAKESWVISEEYEPPFGHAEETSLLIFCRRMNIDLEKTEAELRANGISYESPRRTLKEIGEANGLSAMQLYALFRKHEKPFEPEGAGGFTADEVELRFAGIGIGRMTLAQACEKAGIEPALGAKRLRQQGIAIGDGETLKDAGDRLGLKPIDILKLMLVEQ